MISSVNFNIPQYKDNLVYKPKRQIFYNGNSTYKSERSNYGKFTPFLLTAVATTTAIFLAVKKGKIKLPEFLEKRVKDISSKVEKSFEQSVSDSVSTPAGMSEEMSLTLEKPVQQLADRHGIIPITSAEEYEQEFNKIRLLTKRQDRAGYLTDSRSYPIIDICKGPKNPNGIDDVPLELRGLLPYCGNDISGDINHFLSVKKDIYMPMVESGTNIFSPDFIQGHRLIHVDSEKVKEVIKCLDYSMEQCNKRYGVYEGFVYRGGVFSPDAGMYYSTSARPVSFNVTAQLPHPTKQQFHIIRTTKGTKIRDFQKEFNSASAWCSEEEILLPRDTKYEEIFQTSEYAEEKLNFAKMILEKYKEYNKWALERGEKAQYPESIEEILKKIHVWEEV